jgi:hypothetical protein
VGPAHVTFHVLYVPVVKQCQTYRDISVALFSGNGEHCDSDCCKKMQWPLLLVRAVFQGVEEHFHIHLMHKLPDFFISADNKPVPTLRIFFFPFFAWMSR